jgi:hypothetical protein
MKMTGCFKLFMQFIAAFGARLNDHGKSLGVYP